MGGYKYGNQVGGGGNGQDIVARAKVDEVSAQLADKASKTEISTKADKSYVDTQVQAVASGSPKGSYATLSALQTAFPTGNTNIYVVTADGKWYYWNGSAWTAGGTYQSTGISDGVIAGRNLLPEMVKTAEINILDESKSVNGGYYDAATGNWIASASYRSTDFIAGKAGETFIKSSTVGNHITFWDSNNTFVSGFQKIGATTFEVPNNPTITSFRINIASATATNTTMVVKGSVLPSQYVAYGRKILDITSENVRDKSLTTTKFVDSLTKVDNRNLLDESKSISGGYYDRTTGNWVVGTAYRSTDFIPCIPGETLARTISPQQVGNHITYWDSNKSFISGVDIGSSSVHFTVPNNPSIAYLRSSITNTVDKAKTMIVKGRELPNRYVPYNDVVLKIENVNLEDGTLGFEKFSSKLKQDHFSDDYIKPFSKVVNPILTKTVINDRTGATGVADPFIVMEKGRYHMFFEVLAGTNPNTGQASDEIGHAYSDNLINWTYTGIVLSKEVHGHRSAYPNVFKVDGTWYMLPDTNGGVVLYRATSFPSQWELVDTLLNHATAHGDSNIFKIGNVWYLTTSGGQLGWNGISLYYNESGDFKNNQWNLHPIGLIIPNNGVEGGHRGAGNPRVFEDYVLLPIQIAPVATGVYGQYTKLYKLGSISPTTCIATDLGKLTERSQDGKWNDYNMHHVSSAEYVKGRIYAVDGSKNGEYSIGLYQDN